MRAAARRLFELGDMATKKGNAAKILAQKLREDLHRMLEDARQLELTTSSRSMLSKELERSAAALNGLLAEIDPIDRPAAVFDPGNPRTVGFFVALALTAQPRKPLADLKNFYGSGIYALYYHGPFEAYKAIAFSETPIYVGMAIQGATDRNSSSGGATSLASRLNKHRSNIKLASGTLELSDFSYRSLVVQSGWEAPAESYLISMFRPIWNREIGILYGFGKHGDSSETRKNKRSPWDTLHSGRKWAHGEEQTDAKSSLEILGGLTRHFGETRIYHSFEDVLRAFVSGLTQSSI